MTEQPRQYPTALTIEPISHPVDADIDLPGSKSYTNRALLLAAMAHGRSTLRSALFSDDTNVMVDSLLRLGIAVEADEDANTFVVSGAGGRIPKSEASLFVGNSGTTARFLTAFLALGHGTYEVDGVARMRQRPIEPLLDALRQLGTDAASLAGNGCPPLRVRGHGLRGGTARLAGDRSSQYFSALLMVGPLTRDGLVLEVEGDLVSKPYIDLTAATMRSFGAIMSHEHYQRMVVPGGQRYEAQDYVVEPDASAASYFFALAAATGGRVRVRHLGSSSVQGDARFVEVLEQMGCTVTRDRDSIEVIGPTRLLGVDVNMNAISDTVQTLAAIAPLAEGPVTVHGVGHIRHKETDRIAAVVAELRKLGVVVEEWDDGLRVHPSPVNPTRISTYDDHRMAMSFAILGSVVPGIEIDNPGCVAKTFPDFFERLDGALGR